MVSMKAEGFFLYELSSVQINTVRLDRLYCLCIVFLFKESCYEKLFMLFFVWVKITLCFFMCS